MALERRTMSSQDEMMDVHEAIVVLKNTMRMGMVACRGKFMSCAVLVPI